VSASSAIILFAHGARDPQWAEPFQRIQTLVAGALPGIAVELAFLERMTPDLAEAVARVVKSGAMSVTVVPLFLGAGGHVKEDVAALVVFLASDDAKGMTGHEYFVDAGWR